MLDTTTKEHIEKFTAELTRIENELTLLKEERKELLESYKEKLDTKTFLAAMKIVKIREKVNNYDTLDDMLMWLDGDYDAK